MCGILGFKRGKNNSFAKLNLRMEGNDNGTTFTDSSPVGRAVGTRVSLTTQTAVKKFGTASGYFSGANYGLRYADSADWYMDKGTIIEFWFYPTVLPAYNTNQPIWWGQYVDTTHHMYGATWCAATGTSYAVYPGVKYNGTKENGTSMNVTSSAGYGINSWHHFLFHFDGVKHQGWFNGVKLASSNYTNAPVDYAGEFTVGRCSKSYWYSASITGYIDGFIVRKGCKMPYRSFKAPTRAA